MTRGSRAVGYAGHIFTVAAAAAAAAVAAAAAAAVIAPQAVAVILHYHVVNPLSSVVTEAVMRLMYGIKRYLAPSSVNTTGAQAAL
jgi:hypothetical protein